MSVASFFKAAQAQRHEAVVTVIVKSQVVIAVQEPLEKSPPRRSRTGAASPEYKKGWAGINWRDPVDSTAVGN